MNWLTFFAPLASVFLLVLGNGVSTTLTTIEMNANNASNLAIGLVSSAYFFGLVMGSYKCQSLIIRVRHIRAFAALGTLLVAVVIIQGMFYNFWLWGLLRFMVGYCLAGLYITIESWMLAGSTSSSHGKMLGIYMMVFYLAQASSQLFLNIPTSDVLVLFCVIAMFTALSVVPLAMTRVEAPSPEHPEVISLSFLFKRTSVGVLGCFVSGIILSVIYTFLPKFMVQIEHANAVSYAMFATILGGTLCQFPIGKLSDLIDRRRVIIMTLIGVTIAAAVMMIFFSSITAVIMVCVLLGGMAFAIYPVSITYSIDFIESNRVLSATAMLFVAYGIGSSIGPVLVVPFTYVNETLGYFFFLALVSVIFGLYVAYRMIRLPIVFKVEENQFISMPQTSFEAQQLDPRAHDNTQLEFDFMSSLAPPAPVKE